MLWPSSFSDTRAPACLRWSAHDARNACPGVALEIGYEPLVLAVEEGGGQHEVGAGAIAGDRDVVDDGDAEEGLDVDVVRLRLERIPEEDHEIDAAFGNARPDLLVAAERAREESRDLEIELTGEERAGGTGAEQVVTRECAPVVTRPFEEVDLAIVVRNEGEALARVHLYDAIPVRRRHQFRLG